MSPDWLNGLARAVRRLLPSAERQPAFYDRTFRLSGHMKRQYPRSPYYFLWAVVADRLARRGDAVVLDIGCGAGQVACLLRDKGIGAYCGIDFSAARIEQARKRCPQFEFIQADVFRSNLLDSYPYDTVLALEFLEHVEQDSHVLERIRSGSYVLATVPNFASFAHVHHFDDAAAVASRYGRFFEPFRVDSFPAPAAGKVYFLLEGIRR